MPLRPATFVGLIVVLASACAAAPARVARAPAAIFDPDTGDASADARNLTSAVGGPAPRRADDEALALGRQWDPNAFQGLEASRSPDFAGAGFGPKGVLYARLTALAKYAGILASDLAPYRDRGAPPGVGCLAIPYEYEAAERMLVGSLTRTWREGKDLITEGFALKLAGTAELDGPGDWREVVHADKTTETRAYGKYGVTVGTYRAGGRGRLDYDGCEIVVSDVGCMVWFDVVHDRCDVGPHTCTVCRGLAVGLSGSDPFCGSSATRGSTLGSIEHDCAPCAPDPLGEAIPEVRRELLGRSFVKHARGPSFFATRAACEGAH
jgi:hypothetical protein